MTIRLSYVSHSPRDFLEDPRAGLCIHGRKLILAIVIDYRKLYRPSKPRVRRLPASSRCLFNADSYISTP